MSIRALLCGALPLSLSCAVYDSSLLSGSGGDAAVGGASGGAATSSGASGGASSSGGVVGSGGAFGGSGGNATCTWGETTAIVENGSVFDDFNDNDKLVSELGGRSGRWNSDNDQSLGSQTPSAIGWESMPMAERLDAPGNFALHYVGLGFDSWHLVLGELAGGYAYDLSAYQGVSLWARADCEPATASAVQLRIAISDSLSFASSGTIDHAGIAIAATLTSEWQHLVLPFSAWRRRFGSTALLDASTARALVVSPNAPGDLDVWIDDIVFYTD